ncbi:MAG: ribosomal-protein-alanine N-acetyltransferase [Crocinitomix sp.]|jgi:ribosomal-protein-alanine N-acetyltransferase
MTFLFNTERLQVRPLNMSDISALHKMHSNPNVMQYTGDAPKSIKENHEDLVHVIASYTKPNNNFWVWAIERKTDSKVVGTCALLKTKPEPSEEAEDEIGYRFLEKYWGNGYGSEITIGLLNYAFTKFSKTNLVAEVDELNIASVKILEKHMTFVKAYYSEEYKSNDRKYVIDKTTFFSQNPAQ